MSSSKIDDYVKKQLSLGTSREEIEQKLEGVGWKRIDIDNSFSRVTSPNVTGGNYETLLQAVNDLSRRVAILEGREAPAPIILTEKKDERVVATSVQNVMVSESKEISQDSQKGLAESKVTGKSFATVGVIAILFGVAFFLKYAFDNGLIGEMGRVVLGLITGIVFLFLGEFASRKEKYLQYSFYLSGGGIAILYLSIYSAYWYYNLISQSLAFLMMIATTVVGVYFASRRNSIALSGLALLGGLLTPELMRTETIGDFAYPVYLLILSVGFSTLSSIKKWSPIYYMSLIGTSILSLKWYLVSQNDSSFSLIITMFTLLYGVYFALPVLLKPGRDENNLTNDIVGLVFSSLVYFGVSYSVLDSNHPNITATFFAVWALIALFVASFFKKPNVSANEISNSYGAIGLALLFIAIPIQFDGGAVTLVWFIMGTLTAFLGARLGNILLRIFGYAVLATSIVHLFGYVDMPKAGSSMMNEWFGLAMLSVAGYVFLGEIYRKYLALFGTDEKYTPQIFGVVGVLLFSIAVQVQLLGPGVIIVLGLVGLGLTWGGLRLDRVEQRVMGLYLIGQSLVYLFTNSSIHSDGGLIFNEYFGLSILMVLIIFVCGVVYRNNDSILTINEKNIPIVLGVVGNILLAFTALRESEIYYQDKINSVYKSAFQLGDPYYSYGSYIEPAQRDVVRSLENMQNLMRTLIILVHSALMMMIGIIWKYKSLRLLSIIGFGLIVFKVFLYDVLALSDLYRIISFITLGVILLVVSYLFYRYKEKIKEFILT